MNSGEIIDEIRRLHLYAGDLAAERELVLGRIILSAETDKLSAASNLERLGILINLRIDQIASLETALALYLKMEEYLVEDLMTSGEIIKGERENE